MGNRELSLASQRLVVDLEKVSLLPQGEFGLEELLLRGLRYHRA